MDEEVLKELREIRDKLEHFRYSEHAGAASSLKGVTGGAYEEAEL